MEARLELARYNAHEEAVGEVGLGGVDVRPEDREVPKGRVTRHKLQEAVRRCLYMVV